MSTSLPSKSFMPTTRLSSPRLPIALRIISAHDAPSPSALLGIPIAKSQETIAAQVLSASVPTVLDPQGHVVSGPSRVNMVVVTQQDREQVIGLGGFGAIKQRGSIRAGDVGVLVDETYRLRGYAVEAIRIAVDWAFTPAANGGLQLDLVTLTTAADNVPMITLADEKLGLKGKGVLSNSVRPAVKCTTK